MEKTTSPSVSCICIAGSKPKSLHLSLDCFFGQTYENKELIVVYNKEDIALNKTLETYKGKSRIIYLESSSTVSTDEKISMAVKKANGPYLCFWSSEDWHHVARIEYQYEAIRIKEVMTCVMYYILLRIEHTGEIYISKKRIWEETLFMEKNHFLELDNKVSLTDSLEKLDSLNQLYRINDVPNLYAYLHYEGREVLGNDSWSEIMAYSYKSDAKDSLAIHKVLENREEGSLEKNSLCVDAILGNPLFEEDDKMERKDNIPKIIHLTYKTKEIPQVYRRTFESIQAMHPHWELRIYDDLEAENLVALHFPELLEIYKAYPINIQRVDVFRILVIFLYGGFYLDLDMHCFKSLDALCSSPLVLGEEVRYSSVEQKLLNFKFDCEIQVANYMFGSVAGHPFWIELLMEMIKRSDLAVRSELDVLKSTGPGVLSEVYQKNKHIYTDILLLQNKFKRCHSTCPSVSCHFGDFAAHLHVHDWTWSGKNIDHIILPIHSKKIGQLEKEKTRTIMANRLSAINKAKL